jgi:hypothetical protein
MKHNVTQPQRVDWNDERCMEVALLGDLGFSAGYIMAETGFSLCQTRYRLGKAGVKLMNYRNGTSESAATVRHAVRYSVKHSLRDRLIGKRKRRKAG